MIAAGVSAAIAGALSNYVTLQNTGSAVGIAVAGFIIWRTTNTRLEAANEQRAATTLKTLEDGLKAATLRADAEAARADQLAQVCSAWEVKNAELLHSSVADQTRYLTATKTMADRILELERQLGKTHDDH